MKHLAHFVPYENHFCAFKLVLPTDKYQGIYNFRGSSRSQQFLKYTAEHIKKALFEEQKYALSTVLNQNYLVELKFKLVIVFTFAPRSISFTNNKENIFRNIT